MQAAKVFEMRRYECTKSDLSPKSERVSSDDEVIP